MRRHLRQWGLALSCAAMLGLAADHAASSIRIGRSLGTVLKLGGIVLAVRYFGSDMNKVINTLLAQRGLSYEGATKVVPIVSIGRGAYVGAAQVQGARSLIDDVKAVGELETRLGDLQGRLLLPLNTLNPL